MATVGFDCLEYFWTPRVPAQTASDLERVLRHYLAAWGKHRLLLVGYSFGAGWLPYLVNRLPEDLQRRVASVVLLAPLDYANLEIRPGDWVHDERRDGALEVVPEADAVRRPLLCFYGRQEAGISACPRLRGPNVQRLVRPGGHHFNRDYLPIQEAILATLR